MKSLLEKKKLIAFLHLTRNIKDETKITSNIKLTLKTLHSDITSAFEYHPIHLNPAEGVRVHTLESLYFKTFLRVFSLTLAPGPKKKKKISKFFDTPMTLLNSLLKLTDFVCQLKTPIPVRRVSDKIINITCV